MFNCLLIDDDADDHEFFRMALDRIDPAITCSFAFNGRQGLELLQKMENVPGIMFVDLNMPLMGGLEFLEEVKKSPWAQIPVLIYSTSDEAIFKNQTSQTGAAGYMVKPSTMDALEKGIRNVLKKHLQLPYP